VVDLEEGEGEGNVVYNEADQTSVGWARWFAQKLGAARINSKTVKLGAGGDTNVEMSDEEVARMQAGFKKHRSHAFEGMSDWVIDAVNEEFDGFKLAKADATTITKEMGKKALGGALVGGAVGAVAGAVIGPGSALTAGGGAAAGAVGGAAGGFVKGTMLVSFLHWNLRQALKSKGMRGGSRFLVDPGYIQAMTAGAAGGVTGFLVGGAVGPDFSVLEEYLTARLAHPDAAWEGVPPPQQEEVDGIRAALWLSGYTEPLGAGAAAISGAEQAALSTYMKQQAADYENGFLKRAAQEGGGPLEVQKMTREETIESLKIGIV
jgi:hypothetical protein